MFFGCLFVAFTSFVLLLPVLVLQRALCGNVTFGSTLEQYGSSGQSFFRCPGCLHQKHTLSVVELLFTPWQSADLGILGSWVLGT